MCHGSGNSSSTQAFHSLGNNPARCARAEANRKDLGLVRGTRERDNDRQKGGKNPALQELSSCSCSNSVLFHKSSISVRVCESVH